MKQLIFSILLSLPILAFSQEEAKFYINFDQEPLDTAFERIESIFDVRFSYDDASITDKNITLPKEERSLDQILLALETLTGLTFEIIEDRYIIVNKSSKAVNIQELDRIILTTYLTKGIQKQKDASYEISPLKLGILPGLTEPDVLESIQLLPGVVSPNETASGFMVRGGKMDQNCMIWDGINMYHKGHLFGMISPFNPNATRKVTFINKGTHARYGERASSVVVMETSTEIQDQINGQIGINGINADAYVEAPIIKDKLGIQASLRKSYTNLYRSYTFDQLTEKVFRSTKIEEDDNGGDDFDFLDYNVKINFKSNENNEILGSIISIDNALDYTVSDDNTSEAFNDILDISNDGYSLTWNKIWNSTLTQHTSAFYSEYNLDYNFITNQNGAQVSDFEKRNRIVDSGISTEFTQTLNGHSSLTLGYQYVLKDVSYIFKNTSNLEIILDQDDSEIATHSSYVNYDYKNPKLFELSLGGRVSYFQELDAVRFEPRLLLYKQLFRNFKLQLSGEIKNQIISEIDEAVISDLSLENRVWRLANGNEFPIINSQQASLGFIYTNNGWTIDVDNYIKRLDNVTALSFGFLNPVNSQYNLGKQDIYGLDLFVKKRFKGFNSWISYSYTNSESTYENINSGEPFTSRSNVLHSVSTALSYKISDFQIALGWRWQSGKPFTQAIVTNDGLVFNDAINNQRLPDYHRLDFSSTYSFNFSKDSKVRGKVGLSIRNVYSKDNLISREYLGNNDFNNDIELIDRFSIGFTPNVMFRVYW